MRPQIRTLLWPLLFWVTACQNYEHPAGPGLFDAVDLAEFMGTRAERAERAPYSPAGWPLQRGDVISYERRAELSRAFPSVCGIHAPFWVGDMAFSATWSSSRTALGDAWDPNAKMSDIPVAYLGHVRHYVWGVKCRDRDLPPHLRNLGHEVLAPPATMKVFHKGGDSREPASWTQEQWLDGYTGRDR